MGKATRSVEANGDHIREARLFRGWDAADLAKKAGYSKRSIENAESGKRVDVRTLVAIAEDLDLDYNSLIPGAALERKDLFRVQLLLECDIKEVANSRHLLSLLELLVRLLPEPEAVKLKAISTGSVLLTLEMPEQSAMEFFALFLDFREHARAAVAQTPEGRAYFRGEHHRDGEEVARYCGSSHRSGNFASLPASTSKSGLRLLIRRRKATPAEAISLSSPTSSMHSNLLTSVT